MNLTTVLVYMVSDVILNFKCTLAMANMHMGMDLNPDHSLCRVVYMSVVCMDSNLEFNPIILDGDCGNLMIDKISLSGVACIWV